MTRALALTLALALVAAAGCRAPRPLTVGSKKFTESVILGEMATRLLVDGGLAARHQRAARRHARPVGRAAPRARSTLYPEYTGTLCQEILHGGLRSRRRIERALAQRGTWS